MDIKINSRAVERSARLASCLGVVSDAFRLADRAAGPVLDLFIRLCIAQIFLVSGVLKIANWENALDLSRYEYPVTWMSPVVAAYLGATVELLGAVLLAVGLATRVAALAMMALALVIQFNYRTLDAHLFWTALLGWFVLFGAGRLSLDAMVSHGLGETAIPLAERGLRCFRGLTRSWAPHYQCVFRCWLGGAVLCSASGVAPTAAGWLQVMPLTSAAGFATEAEWVMAALLLVGVATRLSAFGLIVMTIILKMAGAEYTEYGYWWMALGLLAFHGPGTWSVDAIIDRFAKKRFPQLEGKPAFSLDGLPRVVIVGGGFGGITCAAGLARTPVQITLIDRHNYHLFQPLLYQVATTALSPGDIAMPIRGLFREQFNAQVLLGTVTGVDTERRTVLLENARVPYDYLVLATGAAHSYFGKDQWAPFAPGLKRVEDATQVRARLLTAFERAEATEDETERASCLTFLIVGGGPTGVELAGAIAELARFGMEKEFRRFNPAQARVVLIQAGPRVLPTFAEKLSVLTQRSLEKLGVEVLLNSKVEQIDDHGVLVNGKRMAAHTVLWAAGVVASPAAQWLGAPADNAGRINVGQDLSVPGMPNVYAIGDTAASNAWNGQPVPGLAPAAKQAGAYVARHIRARLGGHADTTPFKYIHLGSLATVGRKAAVADFGFVKFSGALAWWLWGAIHLGFLVGVRNRISVMFDWFWAYLTLRSGTRLITDSSAAVAAEWPVRREIQEHTPQVLRTIQSGGA